MHLRFLLLLLRPRLPLRLCHVWSGKLEIPLQSPFPNNIDYVRAYWPHLRGRNWPVSNRQSCADVDSGIRGIHSMLTYAPCQSYNITR